MPFVSLGLSSSLAQPLVKLGYTTPTPVQTQSIPVVLSGRDLLARAQTGTGKTAAFGLPMIDRLTIKGGSTSLTASGTHRATRKPRALVLVPTRELALQVHKSLSTYAVPANLRVTAIFGGVSFGPQRQALMRGTDIVIATPGRLIDHLDQRTIDLSSIEILTLDEADRMLDMGFLPPLRRILSTLPAQRQTLLFSATFSDEVRRLAADFTRDAARVDVSAEQVMATTVTHHVYPVTDQRKGDLLKHVLTQAPVGQALVFCKTKHGSNRVGAYLERAGLTAAVIHGNKSQGARTKALADFKAGRVQVLVATDLAARGLDIAQLPLVVNFDLPLVAADYVHRAGRTGRAGLSGRAVSLVSAADRGLLRDIQRLLPAPIEQVNVEGFVVSATSHEALPQEGRGHGRRPFNSGDRSRDFRRNRNGSRSQATRTNESPRHSRPSRSGQSFRDRAARSARQS
jgi:ATP-dependent RNA helicase RhlE